MAKGAEGRDKPGARTQRPAGAKRARAAAARTALGNDPFERGAAAPIQLAMATPSEPAAAPEAPPPARRDATPRRRKIPAPVAETAAARPEVAEAAAPVAEAAAARPEIAAETSAPASAAEPAETTPGGDVRERVRADLGAFVRRLWPALRTRLEPILGLRRLVAAPAPAGRPAIDSDFVVRTTPLLDFLLDAWWRVEVRGLDRMPAGPAVVVANHGGLFHWDALVLAHVLRRAGRELRPLLDEHALSIPLAGRAAIRLGAVPATPENAVELLRDGVLTAVFPEGSRNGEREWSERYRIRRFGRGGFATVALRAHVPVVPCAIVGGEETAAPFGRPGWLAEVLGLPLLHAAPALPLGPLALLPLPSRWTVRFGEPILPEGSADDATAVNHLTEETRGTLQRMLDEDVASRRSVYL